MVCYILICLIALTVVLGILKIISKLTIRRNGSFVCLVGKTAIVTGSNCGIGLYTALDFASRGAKVILACRNKDRAEEAQKKIIDETGNPNVFVELVDFASLKSVRDFAKRINSKEARLDILVNNAGLIIHENITTEDGLSMTMQVNHLGPFLLTTLLIDLLKKTGSSRIVNVSSLGAFTAQLKPNNLNYFDTSFLAKLWFKNYANTKLCNVLWTNELARRLKGTGVTANSLHPGVVYTNIARNHRKCLLYLLEILKIFMMSPEEGAQTTIYAAVSQDLQNLSGLFLKNCKISSLPKLSLDIALAKKIWEVSEDLVKLTPEERSL